MTRSDLPLLTKNPLSSSNPNGDYLYGIGDVDAQAALIRNINARLAAGFGLRVTAPTGDDALGSGKWQLMPIVGARFALTEISGSSYFEPLLRYDVSVAGDPTNGGSWQTIKDGVQRFRLRAAVSMVKFRLASRRIL